MANKIQIRRGLKSEMPTLSSGEPAYTTDTRELFIGTGSGNVNMGGSHWYRGTAMSGTSAATGAYSYAACPQVKLDDMYMNTSNGNIYACTTAGSGSGAKWTYQGCMKGAKGDTGATGAKGENGGIGIIDGATDASPDGTGKLYVSEDFFDNCAGRVFYVTAAYGWYDTISTNPTASVQRGMSLYDINCNKELSVQQGECALIYCMSSSEAILL